MAQYRKSEEIPYSDRVLDYRDNDLFHFSMQPTSYSVLARSTGQADQNGTKLHDSCSMGSGELGITTPGPK